MPRYVLRDCTARLFGPKHEAFMDGNLSR